MLQNQSILDIQSPIKSYARAAERKSSPRFSRQMTRNYSAWNASANRESQRRKHEQESLRSHPPRTSHRDRTQGTFLESRKRHFGQDGPGPTNGAAKRHCLRGDVYAVGRPKSCFHAEPPGLHGEKLTGKRGCRKTKLPGKIGVERRR